MNAPSPDLRPPAPFASPAPVAPPSRAVPLARLRWWILGLLFASTTINYIDRQALSVLLPLLRTELDLSSRDYGNIVTSFLLAYTVSQLISGLLLDRFGTKHGLAVAVVVWSIAAVGHAFARGASSLGVFRFALGLGEGANWPGGGKAVAEWFPRHRRAFAMGLFDGGSAIGAVLAPPLVSVIALHYGWRAAFVITGLYGLAWWVAWTWIYDTPDRHRWLSPADRASALAELNPSAAPSPASSTPSPASPPAASIPAPSTGAASRPLWRTSQLWALMATRIASSPVWWFYVFWLPDFLSSSRGLSIVEIGLFGWIPYLTVDIGKLAGGALSDRLIARGRPTMLARKSVMVAGAVAMAAGMCVSHADTLAATLAWVCLATFGFGLWSANILAVHADVFPSARMGSALGFTGTAASLAGAGVSYAIGRVLDRLGYDPVFAVMGAVPLLAGIVLIVAVRKPHPAS